MRSNHSSIWQGHEVHALIRERRWQVDLGWKIKVRQSGARDGGVDVCRWHPVALTVPARRKRSWHWDHPPRAKPDERFDGRTNVLIGREPRRSFGRLDEPELNRTRLEIFTRFCLQDGPAKVSTQTIAARQQLIECKGAVL
jgi:ribose transport system ATP-binding protein